jgi:hypothetical protein
VRQKLPAEAASWSALAGGYDALVIASTSIRTPMAASRTSATIDARIALPINSARSEESSSWPTFDRFVSPGDFDLLDRAGFDRFLVTAQATSTVGDPAAVMRTVVSQTRLSG